MVASLAILVVISGGRVMVKVPSAATWAANLVGKRAKSFASPRYVSTVSA